LYVCQHPEAAFLAYREWGGVVSLLIKQERYSVIEGRKPLSVAMYEKTGSLDCSSAKESCGRIIQKSDNAPVWFPRASEDNTTTTE
jgi:hypothetical protein